MRVLVVDHDSTVLEATVRALREHFVMTPSRTRPTASTCCATTRSTSSWPASGSRMDRGWSCWARLPSAGLRRCACSPPTVTTAAAERAARAVRAVPGAFLPAQPRKAAVHIVARQGRARRACRHDDQFNTSCSAPRRRSRRPSLLRHHRHLFRRPPRAHGTRAWRHARTECASAGCAQCGKAAASSAPRFERARSANRLRQPPAQSKRRAIRIARPLSVLRRCPHHERLAGGSGWNGRCRPLAVRIRHVRYAGDPQGLHRRSACAAALLAVGLIALKLGSSRPRIRAVAAALRCNRNSPKR